MDGMKMPSPEELRELLEKAQKEAEAALAKLSPEERAAAQKRAIELMEKDEAERRELLESAGKLAGAPKAAECPHCGAPVSGRVCEYCGSVL
ncbi:MAG: hypothetical protein J6P71_04650 [Oscillospiraceae bacterium]|nr:hypothetical protein [Oscillospiraceae bacterium]